MKRALLSVSDKTGILKFATALKDRGWEILSTGGTARTLRESGLEVTSVSDVTEHPEMMDGRVKTLHPAIHAGILARRDYEEDMKALLEHGYGPIDLVAVNLYPFRETIAAGDVTISQAMDKVDIGGPTMIRAAAKSHTQVWVIVDPNDYDEVITAIDGAGGSELRRELAAKVFSHVSAYDESIAGYLTSGLEPQSLPDKLDISLRRIQTLRYGENPDQPAAFYGHEDPVGLSALRQLHGKELSYNNLLDLDGALLALSPFANTEGVAACCIIKHTTPCGLAVSDILSDAYEKALASDPVSAFGSAIAVNQEIDVNTAKLMSTLFIECLVAPSFSDEALKVLSQKKSIRLLSFPMVSNGKGVADFVGSHGLIPEARLVRSVYGGLLAQTPSEPPSYGSVDLSWKVVSERHPTEIEMDDLCFAWASIFAVKSNAILIARDGGVIGIGAGQMSRVDSSKIAVRKASEAGFDITGAVLASDAFFPFRDGVDAAAEAGVTAVIQPGGSIRDEEVIRAADEHGIGMVLTGRRLFRH